MPAPRRILALTVCLASACRPPPAAPIDAGADRPANAQPPGTTAGFHVCYGAANSAVELPLAQPCATVGASDHPPSTVVPRAPDASP